MEEKNSVEATAPADNNIKELVRSSSQTIVGVADVLSGGMVLELPFVAFDELCTVVPLVIGGAAIAGGVLAAKLLVRATPVVMLAGGGVSIAMCLKERISSPEEETPLSNDSKEL